MNEVAMTENIISSKQFDLLKHIAEGNAAGVDTFRGRDLMRCGGWLTKGGALSAITRLVGMGWLEVAGERQTGVAMRVLVVRPLDAATVVDRDRGPPVMTSIEKRRLADPATIARIIEMHAAGIGLRAIADELRLFSGGAAAVREMLVARGVTPRSGYEQRSQVMRRRQDGDDLPWPKVDKKAGMPPFNIYQDVKVDREAGTFARVNGDIGYSPTGNAGAMCAGN